jgi:hypothetical protein
VDKQLVESLNVVRTGRVFFSHHSVGGNVLEGLARIDAEVGQGAVKIVPIDAADAQQGPAWLDGSGGQNGAPKSKVDFFARTIRERPGLKPALAFMKFCYVDFDPSSNVDELFDYYKNTLSALEREHPEIRFAHVTVPLKSRPMQLKWRVYRVIGREVWEEATNVKRRLFNEKLLKTYGSGAVFDLAKAESTRPDGTRESFTYQGRPYFALYPSYTNDGGHLNALGQRVAAADMVRFVASALAQARPPS